MTGIASKLTALIVALSTALSGGTTDKLVEDMKSRPEIETSRIETIDPVELCGDISIGWNLGNTLDATGGSGLSTETSWGNPKATEELILAVKKAGFNALRVPTTWYKHCSGEDFTIDPEWMDRVQEVVDYGYKNGMYVILNAHHEDFNDPYDATYAEASRKLTAIWRQVAERFKDYDEHLIFEGQNEPRKRNTRFEWNGGDAEGKRVVNQLNADFVKTVRATGGNNALRVLMIPTYAASESSLNGFELPDDDRLIVDIHAYTPYNFAMNYKGGTTSFTLNNSDTSGIKSLAKKLNERFIQKGVGVVIGETGATDKNNLADRLVWAKFFPAEFAQYGIPVFMWDNNGFGTGDEKYGLIDRYTLEWKYPEYIKTLVESANS